MSYFYMPNNFIYMLTDPRGFGFVYVGRAKSPKNRIHSHMRPTDGSRRSAWIKDLKFWGLRPIMTVMEEVPFDNVQEAEDKAVAKCKEDYGEFCLNDETGPSKYREIKDMQEEYNRLKQLRYGD